MRHDERKKLGWAWVVALLLMGCAHSIEPSRGVAEVGRPKQSMTQRCSALRFDGAGPGVRIPDTPGLDGGGEPMTIEAWIRPAAGVVDEPWHPNIIGKRDENTVYPSWAIGIGPERQIYTVADDRWVYGETRVPLDRWTHVAVVFDGEEVRAYVDGQLELQARASRLGPPNRGAVYLGALATGVQRYRGDIGGVRVSSIARYRQRFVPTRTWSPDASTLVLLTLSEGEGAVVHDASGRGHDGAIVGPSWIHECP